MAGLWMLSLPVWQPGPKFLLGRLYPWSQVPYGVSVQESLSRRSLSRWSLSRRSLSRRSLSKGSLSRGYLSRGVSVQGSLCPRGSLSRGVSVQVCLCPGALSLGGLCPGALCPGGSLSRWALYSGGSLSRGDFCPGGFLYDIVSCLAPRWNVVSGGPLFGRSLASGVSVRETASPAEAPHTVKNRQYASY